MSDLVKLSTARELVDAGAVRQAEVVGMAGGWAVQLHTLNDTRVLATKQAEPRRFGSFESALKVLRDMGVRLDTLRVDARRWDPEALIGAPRRPDRSAAMRLKEADARYAAMLRDDVLEARADPRPALSSEDAKARMDAIKARHRQQLGSL